MSQISLSQLDANLQGEIAKATTSLAVAQNAESVATNASTAASSAATAASQAGNAAANAQSSANNAGQAASSAQNSANQAQASADAKLSAVVHDATLSGNGTAGSPLSVATKFWSGNAADLPQTRDASTIYLVTE